MVDILAFGTHPDDLEFGCGGILAKMANQKKSIVMVDLTVGEKSSHGTPSERRKEGEASAKLIGAKRVFLDFPDAEIYDTYEGRLKLVKVIREYKPKLILAPLWKGESNHPDHLACGMMARAACRYARFSKILPDLPTHRPEGILHYLGYNHDGLIDFLIDISDYADTWKKMMECFQTQMKTINYIDWNLRHASQLGVLINKPYAQALTKGNPVEIDDLLTISKATQEI